MNASTLFQLSLEMRIYVADQEVCHSFTNLAANTIWRLLRDEGNWYQ